MFCSKSVQQQNLSYWVQLLTSSTAVERNGSLCYDCPVTNCTVCELLCHIGSDNNYSYNNGANTAAPALSAILSVS